MSNDSKNFGAYVSKQSRKDQIDDLLLSAEEFAANTGANTGFAPEYPMKWMMFWKADICEQHMFETSFPPLTLHEAQLVWMAMEETFLSKYDRFLRVWPEWASSGIWAIPYPGSRGSGPNVLYENLPIPDALVRRFEAWQTDFDDHDPGAPESFDWQNHDRIADGLAHDLKLCVGSKSYVEPRELIEVCLDGGIRDCRQLLGLPPFTRK